MLVLRCVYTHSTDMDTWRRTCSVVSQLTHYSTTYQQLGQLKKIRQWEKSSVSLQTGQREGFHSVRETRRQYNKTKHISSFNAAEFTWLGT